MATLTVQQIVATTTALGPTYASATSTGDDFPNDGQTFFHVKNTNGSPVNVTINSIKACDQGSDHDIVVSVPATTGDKMIGPFPPSRYNDGNGRVQVTYASVTGVTVAAIKF